jgi:hypothetical protein
MSFVLSVTIKSIILIVVILSVIILNDVAPNKCCSLSWALRHLEQRHLSNDTQHNGFIVILSTTTLSIMGLFVKLGINDTHQNDTHQNDTHQNDTHPNDTHQNGTQCNSIQYRYAECCYSECLYAERRGAVSYPVGTGYICTNFDKAV